MVSPSLLGYVVLCGPKALPQAKHAAPAGNYGLGVRDTIILGVPGGWEGSGGARKQLHGREWQLLIPPVAKASGFETSLLFLEN